MIIHFFYNSVMQFVQCCITILSSSSFRIVVRVKLIVNVVYALDKLTVHISSDFEVI